MRVLDTTDSKSATVCNPALSISLERGGMNMNMNIGDAHGGRGRRWSLPPPAAVAIAVYSIAVSSIVANLSTDHVPGGGSVTDGTAEGAKMGEDGSGIATVTPAASATATVATIIVDPVHQLPPSIIMGGCVAAVAAAAATMAIVRWWW